MAEAKKTTMRVRLWTAMCIVVPALLAIVTLVSCETRETLGKSCTLYIYLCGSDLEAKYGLAGANIDELLEAKVPDEVSIILETGGSSVWHSHDIDPGKIQRYEVCDRELVLVEEDSLQNMGDSDTLTDFLTWGSENYPAERNMLVLWDHGGKSAEEICYDEAFSYDALDRKELAKAFARANLPFKFDLVMLDACYMAAVENAALLDDYADYLIASQEVIPSGGLDYQLIAHEFAYLDDEELGRAICDAYLEKCQQIERGELVELSLMDLSRTDDMLSALDDLCAALADVHEDGSGARGITNAAKYSSIYGTKAAANLFDLSSFLHATEYFDNDIDNGAVAKALEGFVPHRIAGSAAETVGVSLYYPISYDKSELRKYLATCPLEHYDDLLDEIYGTKPAKTIAFADRGSISEEGDFSVSLTEDSLPYLSSVTYTLDRKDPESGSFVALGTGCGLAYDPATLTYTSTFDGRWPSYAGMPLYTTVTQMLPHAVSYASPICVDGTDYEILSVYKFDEDYGDGSYAQSYVWGGYDKHGIPSRDYYLLDPGDSVQVYAAADEEGESLVVQDAYVIPDDLTDKEATQTKDCVLPDGTYRYQFEFTDIFGDIKRSDPVLLEIEDGEVRMLEVAHA